jgi:dienelactone hydrolase
MTHGSAKLASLAASGITGLLLAGLLLAVPAAWAAEKPAAPRTVEALWADFDPREEALDAQVVREWERDGLVLRYVTYHVGTFKGERARMAAFFGFPKGAEQVPGLLHLHGGGQRAFLREVQFYASQGYACLSINWGGREMEDAQPADPNTDWGAVDPTQKNVPGYFNLLPGYKYMDPVESPRNNNWYLLTLGARRGLTFLEQQPQVDADRLGVYGHSMGGNLTIYVAGSDERVKVAAPSAGGSGFRTIPWPLLPEQRKRNPKGDVELYRATLSYQAYARRIQAPVLWLTATNDFHGIMDDTYRTGALIPHGTVRYAIAPHLNHRFTPPCAVSRPLWLDQHLKGTFAFPATPKSKLLLATNDHIPELRVTPDASKPIAEVHLYYSVGPDPQARFWRSAEATETDGVWTAPLPILSLDAPLFAFANVIYRLQEPHALPHGRPVERFAISSLLHTAAPDELKRAGVKATDEPSRLIDDFSGGWRDWYRLNIGNPHHWEFSTRKIADPKWRGRPGQRLALEVQADQPNPLVIILTENFFRHYRGKQRQYIAVVNLTGGKTPQTIALNPADFKTPDGQPLASWTHLDILTFRPYLKTVDTLLGTPRWTGPPPTFRSLRWLAVPP